MLRIVLNGNYRKVGKLSGFEFPYENVKLDDVRGVMCLLYGKV